MCFDDLWEFLSTPSARRATPLLSSTVCALAFLSTPSARRATKERCCVLSPSRFLSTPSARRATAADSVFIRRCYISIHALREEGDRSLLIWKLRHKKFLSTPSARRATRRRESSRATKGDFYPRPPRGGRPTSTRAAQTPWKISIHALREEGDLPVVRSRPGDLRISIHALREEGDVYR